MLSGASCLRVSRLENGSFVDTAKTGETLTHSYLSSVAPFLLAVSQSSTMSVSVVLCGLHTVAAHEGDDAIDK